MLRKPSTARCKTLKRVRLERCHHEYSTCARFHLGKTYISSIDCTVLVRLPCTILLKNVVLVCTSCKTFCLSSTAVIQNAPCTCNHVSDQTRKNCQYGVYIMQKFLLVFLKPWPYHVSFFLNHIPALLSVDQSVLLVWLVRMMIDSLQAKRAWMRSTFDVLMFVIC